MEEHRRDQHVGVGHRILGSQGVHTDQQQEVLTHEQNHYYWHKGKNSYNTASVQVITTFSDVAGTIGLGNQCRYCGIQTQYNTLAEYINIECAESDSCQLGRVPKVPDKSCIRGNYE